MKYESYSQLVGTLYDAALDPGLWDQAIDMILDFVGGQAGGLISRNLVSASTEAHYHVGFDRRFIELYVNELGQFDPTADLRRFDAGEVISISDLMSHDEFRQGRFYREWAKPQGWIDAASVVLEKSETNVEYLSIIRAKSDGVVDDEMRRRLAAIAPHVRRALLVGNLTSRKQAEAATFADVLDGLSAGIFLIDAEGGIVHANDAAQEILASDDFLRSVSGQLVARDYDVNQVLRAIGLADGAEIGEAGTALPLSGRDGARYVAHVLPLKSGVRRKIGLNYSAAAALFVRKTAMRTSPVMHVIGKTFGLTPTELRVLLAIVEVGGVPQVAAALGVAETTIKTHLGRLFEKTGASRQADLVKLVAGFSTPLAG